MTAPLGEPARARRIKGVVRLAVGLVAGVVFAVLLLRNVELHRVSATLREARPWPLLLGLMAFAADFGLRAARYWYMVRSASDRRLPLGPTVGPFIAGFGISDVLPLRAGDGFRIIWFNRLFAIDAGTLIGAMMVERLLDLIALVILGGLALRLVDITTPQVLLSEFKLVLTVAGLAGIGLLLAPEKLFGLLDRMIGRIAGHRAGALRRAVRSICATVRHMGSSRRLIMLLAMSLLCWLLESLTFLCAWISMGGPAGDFAKPFLAFCFSVLGTLVPSLPGHFGSFEYFGVQAFTLTGVDPSFAAAVVFLAHMLIWTPTAIFGVGWVVLHSMRPGRATGERGSNPSPASP